MVEKKENNDIYVYKEFAVLFKRIKKTDTITEFVPYDVVEGEFIPEDNWFMDINEIVYPHIAEPMTSGVGFAGRLAEEVKLEDADEFFKNIKEEMLDAANKVIYIRDTSKDNYITIIDKETYESYLMEDDDTETIYRQYETNDFEENYNEPVILEEPKTYIPDINMTPSELTNEITKTIKGQDEAIKKITTALWTTIKFSDIGLTKKNMLIVGPSGVGKTAIFKKISDVLDYPISIFDISGTSQSGYVGRSVDEILTQVYYDNGGNIARAEKSIVILDELDKLAYGTTNSGDISTSGVQNELLKIIEGCKRTIKVNQDDEVPIDTSKMIFVGTGAFEELYEEEKKTIGFGDTVSKRPPVNKTNTLYNYGLKKQLLGRLPNVVVLNNMTKDILKDIILNSNESEFMITLQALKLLGVKVTNPDELVDLIIEDAISKDVGARGLVATINNIFLNIFYEVANNKDKYKEVTINNNILKDNTDYLLIPRKNKQRIKTNNLGRS